MAFQQRVRLAGFAAVVVGALVAVVVQAEPPERREEVLARDAASSGGGGRSPVFDEGPDARAVLQRAADDGTRITVVELVWPGAARGGMPGPEGWSPPPHCFPIGDLEVGLAGTRQTAMGWAAAFAPVDADAVVRGSGVAGHAGLGPFVYAAVQVRGSQEVALVVEGDVVDAAEPEGGWVVLAAELPARGRGEPPPEATVRAGGEQLPLRAEQENGPECVPPPPPLPEEASPASNDVAEAVVRAYELQFEPEQRPADIRDLVSHGDRFDDALLEQVRQLGDNFPDISLETGEVGLLDESTAVLQFRLVGPVPWQVGQADLVDGRWRVSAQTFCTLIGMSGITCPDDIWDPGAGPNRLAQRNRP